MLTFKPSSRLGRPSFMLLLLPLLSATGCQSKTAPTPENFIKGLNTHFAEHPDCLLPQAPHFPYETSDPAETRQMDSLVGSKLLTVAKEPSLHVSRYTPTEIGTRYAPRFCFGHRVISGVDSFTPPTQANGFTETTVHYRYTIQEVPVWAKSDQVKSAFPALAHALNGESTATATLAGTMVGWQVPD